MHDVLHTYACIWCDKRTKSLRYPLDDVYARDAYSSYEILYIGKYGNNKSANEIVHEVEEVDRGDAVVRRAKKQ